MFGSDKKAGPIGSVRHSTQVGFFEKLCQNRFNKKPTPVYDVLDVNGEIAYTVLVPMGAGAPFLGIPCFPTSYGDESYLAIVPGPRGKCATPQTRRAGADLPTAGWVVPVYPRYANTIDNCLKKCHGCIGCLSKVRLSVAISS